VRFFLCCLIAAIGTAETSHAAQLDARHAAIDRALNYLYKTASDDAAFSRFGEDLLWSFYTISHTAADRELSESARTMGRRDGRRGDRSPNLAAERKQRYPYTARRIEY
jgi:hypothetical protein